MSWKRYLPLLILAGIAILIQLVFTVFGAVYFLTQLTMSAYYCLVAIGLCLLMGHTGQISLGHAGFFAIGGYTSAVLTTYNLLPFADSRILQFFQKIRFVVQRFDLYGEEILSVSPWIAFLAAVVIALAIAVLIGLPVTRLKGHYLAMATLGFGVIVYAVVLGTELFGESDGISSVPGFRLFLGLEVNGRLKFRIQNYYIAWFLILVALTVSLNLIHSRVGRALRSIHGNEEASNALGINAAKYKLYVFVFSAALAAIGGAFAAHYNGGIGPSESAVIKSVRYVAIVAVGGMSNLWGVLFMGMLLNFLSLRGYFGTYDDAVFGVILIAIMLFAPRGILRAAFWENIKGRIANRPGKPLRVWSRLRLPAWVTGLTGKRKPRVENHRE
jgi:branched-chain amino acid transport system permease protein